MSELRPKPALRVDTRINLASHHPLHSQHASFASSAATTTATSTTAASDRADSQSPADVTCSIWWDGEVLDETTTMRLRRGRMTITKLLRKQSAAEQQKQALLPEHTAAAASQPSTPPLELSSVQEMDVLIKSFQARRPTAEDVQHMRYDFEAFQHLDFFASSALNGKGGRERRRLTAPSAHGVLPPVPAAVPVSSAFVASALSSSSASSASSSASVGGGVASASISIPYIKPLQLLHDSAHGMALIYGDSGGVKLSDLISSFTSPPHTLPSPAQLLSFLHCALSLTDLLGALHSAGVIYGALRPSNTLYCTSTHIAQFFDYSHSSLLSSEKQAVDKMTFPTNSLPYTAPEATGRMNRSIDMRSDLYSLGCTLLELLTGRPPFVSADPMEVIHCHLAKHPPPAFAPSLVAGSDGVVYRMIDEIVHKLLQKPAEDRYQTAAGLRADLLYCMHVLNNERAMLASSLDSANSSLLPVVPGGAPNPFFSPLSASHSLPTPPVATLAIPATTPAAFRSLIPSQSTITSSAAAGLVEAFKVGRMDLNSIFRVSQKLYGRGEQVDTLLSAFERVSRDGRVELVLVSGYSGIGKTSLVDEIHKPVVREKGLFIRGKFDLYKRNVSCLLEAFSSFILQLLADDAHHIEAWRVALLAALGANAAVIIDIVPELEKLIGEQPAVPKAGPEETQFRFDATFLAFLGVFAKRDHPLVLFVDDLQWADSKSLQLLRLVFTQDVGYVLLICAYRDNEVDSAHPFIRLVNELKALSSSSPPTPATSQPTYTSASSPPTEPASASASFTTSISVLPASPALSSASSEAVASDTATIHTILLTPLRLTDIVELVVDTLHCSEQQATPLAQLLLQKTSANPFYLFMMLQSFYSDALIAFDFDSGHWTWNVEQLRLTSSGQTNDVVDLLCTQIGRFTAQQQQMMKLAACLGNHFSLHTLAVVSQRSAQEVASELWEIMKTGLLLSLGPSFEVFLLATEGQKVKAGSLAPAVERVSFATRDDASATGPSPSPRSGQLSSRTPETPTQHPQSLTFRFMHDRVQQAAYRLIAADEVRATHIRIGRLLRAHTPPAELEAHCFEIVGQLNYAAPDLLQGRQEARELIRLNIMAGRRAKASLAYESSVRFLEAGLLVLQRLHAYAEDGPVRASDKIEEVKQMDSAESKPAVEEAKEGAQSAESTNDPDELCWKTDFDLSFELYRELVEAVFLHNDYKRCVTMLSTVLRHTHDPLQRVLVLELQMQPYIQQHQMRPALDVGLEALRVLGVELVPEILLGEVDDPQPPIWNEAALAGSEVMTDPIYLAAMRILSSLCAPCYTLDGTLFARVACTMVRISCDKGPAPLSAVGLGLYCILLNGFRRLKSGWLVGRWSLKVLQRFPASMRELTAKVYGCYYAHCWQYNRRLRDALPYLLDAVSVGTEAGDLEWSGYDTFYATDTMFFAGEPLDAVSRSQHDFLDALVKRKQLLQSTYLNIWRRLVLHLTLRATERYQFHGKLTTDADILHHLQDTQNHMFLFAFHLAACVHAFYQRKYGEAVEQAELAGAHSQGVVGMILNSVWSFYYSLALLNTIPLPRGDPRLSFARPPPVAGPDFYADIVGQQMATRGGAPGSAAMPCSPASTSPVTPGTGSPQSPDEPFPYPVSAASVDTAHVEATLAKVVEQQAYLSQLSANCPANFLPLFALVEAERTRIYVQVQGRMEMVPYCVSMFDIAINSARQHRLVHAEAIAHECAAYFHLANARKSEAKSYMRDAHFAYGRWGCTAKVQQLSTLYPNLLKKAPISALSGSDRSGGSERESGSASSMSSDSAASSSDVTPTFFSPVRTCAHRQSSHAQSADGHMQTPGPASSPPVLGENTPGVVPLSRLSSAAMSRGRTISSNSPSAPSLSPPSVSTSLMSDMSHATPHQTQDSASTSLESILRACATFSVETDLSKLLRHVMLLLIQHANASKGYLALMHDGPDGMAEWRVEVQANVEDEYDHVSALRLNKPHKPPSDELEPPPLLSSRSSSVVSLPSSSNSSSSTPGRAPGISVEALPEGLPVADCLPVSVFNLVVSTQSTLLLSAQDIEPSSRSPFARDPYFAMNHPKSLLCSPIKQQSKMVAVLYLENSFFQQVRRQPISQRTANVTCVHE